MGSGEDQTGYKSNFQKKGKREPGENRRQWPRFRPAEVPSLKSVTSTTGTEIEVVNISRGGALLETQARLAPGTKIMLKVVTIEGVIQIPGQVLRSHVSSLKGIPKYQSAVEFEHPLRLLDDLSEPINTRPQSSMMALDSSENLNLEGEPSPTKAKGLILSVSASEFEDTALNEMLKLNDW